MPDSRFGIGGTIGIHFIGSTPMTAPDCCVPRQYHTRRRIQPGDFVFCELTSTWWDYSGQVLRGFTVNSIGEANANFVTEYLHNERIKIVAQDLLGVHPRKLYYFPGTGKVLVKKIQELHNHTIVDRESEYNLRLRNVVMGGEVEIFK